MPSSKRFLSSGIVGLILAFSILALAGVVALRSEDARRGSGASLRHTLEVENGLHRLLGLLQSAESGERGYLLTRDEKYFEPYKEASDLLAAQVKSLADLVADNPRQTAAIAELQPLLEERLSILKQKIGLMRSSRYDDAVALIRSGRGKALMDRLHVVISDMMSEEERLHMEREQALQSTTASLRTAIGALIAIVAAVAFFAVYNAQRQMNALEASSSALRGAYNQLLEETTRRETLETQLRQAQKLDALGQMTGGIAHDFNNMLGVIVASLNLLRRRLDRGEGGHERLIDSAMDGAEKAANLVRRLLAFSRMQPLAPESLNVNDRIDSMSEILRRTLGEGVKLETALTDDLWLTKVDANELESAVVNLAVNARDAMPGGGKLTIETANTRLDEDYASRNAGVKPGDYVMISVTDTGEGMTPDIVAKAFDPFFTTKPVGKGTGLGLSQVFGFIKQSDGHVQIYSEPRRGTSIKLYLPRFASEAEVRAAPRAAAPEAFPLGSSDEVILIVEDDETARRVTVEGVHELGYTALEADSGPAALKILAQRPDIALLVTDVVMPGMDGARLAREALFRRPSLRVLHISGYSRNAVMHNKMIDPNIHLLSKPFTLEELARKIRALLDRT